MTTQTEALSIVDTMKLALEALERIDLWLKARYSGIGLVGVELDAITAIKEALSELEQDDEVLGFNGWGFPIEKPSQPEQEPVAYANDDWSRIDFPIGKVPTKGGPIYTTPPQHSAIARKPLTDEQIYEIHENSSNLMEFTRAVEAAHGIKEKNNVSR